MGWLAVALPAGTPADKLLQMLTDLLDGTLPNLQDILLIQSSILEARDIYQPWRLGKQLLETKDLEVCMILAGAVIQNSSACKECTRVSVSWWKGVWQQWNPVR